MIIKRFTLTIPFHFCKFFSLQSCVSFINVRLCNIMILSYVTVISFFLFHFFLLLLLCVVGSVCSMLLMCIRSPHTIHHPKTYGNRDGILWITFTERAHTRTYSHSLVRSFALIHLLISVHCSIIRLFGARAHARVRARSFTQYYYVCIYMRISIYCRWDCAGCARVRALSLVHSVFCDDLEYQIHQHKSLIVVVVLTIF